MKTNIHVTFEGSIGDLNMFLTSTFRNPESLTLTVTVGVPVMEPAREPAYEELLRQCSSLLPSEKLHADYKVAVDAARNGQAITAIKQLRTIANMDLRKAKDFYEQKILSALGVSLVTLG